jgi:phage tail tape-measure protein
MTFKSGGRNIVDDKYLEFLGNLFLSAAKNKKQMEDLLKLSRQGFKGFEDMSLMFRKFYGLENIEKDAPEYMKNWRNATEEFQNTFKEYMTMMGVVPREDYIKLLEKYEELKKKVADHEETIHHLKLLLRDKSVEQGETVKVFQDLMTKQSEQFMEIMNSVGQYFQKEDPDKK